MERLRQKILYSALGASNGLTGLFSLSKCSGSTCTSCLGCAGIGIGLLLIVLFRKLSWVPKESKTFWDTRGGKQKNGVA